MDAALSRRVPKERNHEAPRGELGEALEEAGGWEVGWWVFPKIGGKPPNHPFVHGGFHYKTIHFGVPLFLEAPWWYRSFWGG